MNLPESTAAQDWRAVAILPSGERLLCFGGSSAQVRAAYAGAWGEVIRDEDRPTVKSISLQRWVGQLWAGQWEHQSTLAVPTARVGKSVASEPSVEAGESVVEAEAEVAESLDVDGEAAEQPLVAEAEAAEPLDVDGEVAEQPLVEEIGEPVAEVAEPLVDEPEIGRSVE